MIFVVNPLDAEIVVCFFALDKKVAKDLVTTNKATADKWLEESWNGYGIINNTKHLINIEVLNHCLVVKDPEMKHSIINVA